MTIQWRVGGYGLDSGTAMLVQPCYAVVFPARVRRG